MALQITALLGNDSVVIAWSHQQTRTGQLHCKRANAFSTRSVLRCYKEDKLRPHIEAASNTSTVALRVVGGDEKEPSAWEYNWATLFLRDIYKGTWLSRLGGVSSLRQ
jgi:hypothetical protein